VRTGASEETLDEEFDDEPEAKSGSKKLIIIIGLVLVLLGGGATAAYMTGMLKEFLGIEDATAGSETAEAPPPPPVQSVYHPLPTMLANLAGGRGQPQFRKFTVSLELTDRDVIPRLRKLEPRIIDILQTHFRNLRIDDLRESRGIPVLRAELLARINSAIHPPR
jgi:flagellar FliL protein